MINGRGRTMRNKETFWGITSALAIKEYFYAKKIMAMHLISFISCHFAPIAHTIEHMECKYASQKPLIMVITSVLSKSDTRKHNCLQSGNSLPFPALKMKPSNAFLKRARSSNLLKLMYALEKACWRRLKSKWNFWKGCDLRIEGNLKCSWHQADAFLWKFKRKR